MKEYTRAGSVFSEHFFLPMKTNTGARPKATFFYVQARPGESDAMESMEGKSGVVRLWFIEINSLRLFACLPCSLRVLNPSDMYYYLFYPAVLSFERDGCQPSFASDKKALFLSYPLTLCATTLLRSHFPL